MTSELVTVYVCGSVRVFGWLCHHVAESKAHESFKLSHLSLSLSLSHFFIKGFLGRYIQPKQDIKIMNRHCFVMNCEFYMQWSQNYTTFYLSRSFLLHNPTIILHPVERGIAQQWEFFCFIVCQERIMTKPCALYWRILKSVQPPCVINQYIVP